jgi:hypothetical protein
VTGKFPGFPPLKSHPGFKHDFHCTKSLCNSLPFAESITSKVSPHIVVNYFF